MKLLNEILLMIIPPVIAFLLKQVFKKRKKIFAFIKSQLKSNSTISEKPFYFYCRIAAASMPVLGFTQIGCMYLENAPLYKIALISVSFIYNYILFTAIGDDLFKRLNLSK